MAEEHSQPLSTRPSTKSEHTLHPPSPSPSEPEESLETSATSRTPSQLPPTSETPPSPSPNLINNPDYLALQSSLTLLQAQQKQVAQDMRRLATLKQKALSDPAWFKHVLVTGELARLVPKKIEVVKCPRVEWEKYGSLGARLGREVEKPPPVETMFTGVQLFPPLNPHKEPGLL